MYFAALQKDRSNTLVPSEIVHVKKARGTVPKQTLIIFFMYVTNGDATTHDSNNGPHSPSSVSQIKKKTQGSVSRNTWKAITPC